MVVAEVGEFIAVQVRLAAVGFRVEVWKVRSGGDLKDGMAIGEISSSSMLVAPTLALEDCIWEEQKVLFSFSIPDPFIIVAIYNLLHSPWNMVRHFIQQRASFLF